MISPLFILEGRSHICSWTLAWNSRFLWTAMALLWSAFSARMVAGFCCSFCGRSCPHAWKLRDLTCIFSPILSDMMGSSVRKWEIGSVYGLEEESTCFYAPLPCSWWNPASSSVQAVKTAPETDLTWKKTVVLSFAFGDCSPILNCWENLYVSAYALTIPWISQHGNEAELLDERNKKIKTWETVPAVMGLYRISNKFDGWRWVLCVVFN